MDKKFMLLIIVLSIFAAIATADPPSPLNIKGYGFYANGTGLDNGWIVHINNTNTGSYITTQIFAPTVPSLKGIYSGTVLGSIGDFVVVWIFNESNYGIANKTVTGTTTEINVSLNLTRSSETNVTIIIPEDNTVTNLTINFTVSANIAIIGGQDATSCTAQVYFGNNSLYKVGDSKISLGDINLGTSVLAEWNVTPILFGTTDIYVNASCTSDGINLDHKDIDVAYNISIRDIFDPIVNLELPLDNNMTTDDNNITFYYNVSDDSLMSNCSLYIDGVINQTDLNVIVNVTDNFTAIIQNGVHNWTVGCYDNAANFGITTNYSINVSVFSPNIISMEIFNSIMLIPNSNTTVQCNVTVYERNGVNDIQMVNVTFHDDRDSPLGIELTNSRLHNTSCAKSIIDGDTANYTCSFEVPFFANNGTWNCNATALDNASHVSYNNKTTEILPLYSFDINPLVVVYGNVPAGSISQEKILNFSNVGNANFSLYVWGYGGWNASTGAGLSYVCNGNNVSIEYSRYNNISSTYSSKTSLTSTSSNSGFSMRKITDYTDYYNYSTYWQLQLPTGPTMELGTCNGTIVVEAFG